MLYKKIDAASESSVTSALDLFRTPPTSTDISNAYYREYQTLNPITSTPFHFKIHPITSFIDLSKCYLLTEFKIVKVAGDTKSDLAATDVISTCQMPGGTFIRNLVCFINGKEVFNANQLYAYKAYLDVELSYPKHVKDTYMSVVGYYPDGEDQDSITGAGFVSRKNLFAKSGAVQFITNIEADIFCQDLYLINNCEVDLEITPQRDDFMLIQAPADDTTYKLELQSIRLYVKTIELMDGLSLDIARRLDGNPARYSMRKSMLKSLFITEGRYEFHRYSYDIMNIC